MFLDKLKDVSVTYLISKLWNSLQNLHLNCVVVENWFKYCSKNFLQTVTHSILYDEVKFISYWDIYLLMLIVSISVFSEALNKGNKRI